jgi:hypothetical protein
MKSVASTLATSLLISCTVIISFGEALAVQIIWPHYNMSLKRHMHINGVCQSQIEPVIPDIPIIPLGVAATNILNAVRIKLRIIKEIVMVYP